MAGLAPIWHWGRGPVVSPADATRGQQRAASAWASSCLPAASWCAGARRGLRDISISMVGRGSWWTASVCELSPACPNHRAEGAALRHQIRHSRRMTSNEPSAEKGSGQQRFPSFPVVSNDDGLTTRCRWHLQSERIGRTRQVFLYFSCSSNGTVLTFGLGVRGRACSGWDGSVAAAARRSSKSGAT